jgi:hypothetical protein
MVFESRLYPIWLLSYSGSKTAFLMHFQWDVQNLQAHNSFLHYARKGPFSNIQSHIMDINESKM